MGCTTKLGNNNLVTAIFYLQTNGVANHQYDGDSQDGGDNNDGLLNDFNDATQPLNPFQIQLC